jgi:hypothetical protein
MTCGLANIHLSQSWTAARKNPVNCIFITAGSSSPPTTNLPKAMNLLPIGDQEFSDFVTNDG